MATVHKKIAVAIEYFNKIQNNRHSENFKMFHSLRFDSNLSYLQKNPRILKNQLFISFFVCVLILRTQVNIIFLMLL
jgi:hypothetical protein